jgi:hypothetical protein
LVNGRTTSMASLKVSTAKRTSSPVTRGRRHRVGHSLDALQRAVHADRVIHQQRHVDAIAVSGILGGGDAANRAAPGRASEMVSSSASLHELARLTSLRQCPNDDILSAANRTDSEEEHVSRLASRSRSAEISMRNIVASPLGPPTASVGTVVHHLRRDPRPRRLEEVADRPAAAARP